MDKCKQTRRIVGTRYIASAVDFSNSGHSGGVSVYSMNLFSIDHKNVRDSKTTHTAVYAAPGSKPGATKMPLSLLKQAGYDDFQVLSPI